MILKTLFQGSIKWFAINYFQKIHFFFIYSTQVCPSARGGEKTKKPSSQSIYHSILFLVGRHFKIVTNSGIFYRIFFLFFTINILIYLLERFQMHDSKRIFISFGDFCPYMSSTFKHNTVMIYVTKNGSGLTLEWSGTPQFTHYQKFFF